MKTLKYEITKTAKFPKELEVENEEFICVESYTDGISCITAFIGKGEGNNDKKKIEVSKSGNFLNIERMAGSADINAISLLKKSDKNKVVKKSEFIYWLKTNEYKLKDALKLLM